MKQCRKCTVRKAKWEQKIVRYDDQNEAKFRLKIT